MAHSRTAKKNVRQNIKRRARNRAANSAMRTEIKRVEEAVEANDTAAAQAALPQAQKLIDKAAKTHRMHPNKAARAKSQLARAINGLGQ
ncbi:MAG: 30S ribosomal protein S20 [Planctomycetota bacterium]|jgi:small subunit ribosomal protein S20